jgi:hypothetical protein
MEGKFVGVCSSNTGFFSACSLYSLAKIMMDNQMLLDYMLAE